MCGLAYFKTAAQISYFASSAAALLIPNAWPAVSVIYEGQGDPDQLFHAAQEAAAAERAAMAAKGGANGMPMGGMGGGGGQKEERERTTWLSEDEDVWGGDGDTAPPVIG